MLPSSGLLNETSYTLYGEREKVLVFIHGVGMNQHFWQPQVDHFSEQYRVLTYDMLGHGVNGHRCRPHEDVTLDDYADQLDALFVHLGIEQAVVIGHSMGALISVAYALRYPQKVTALLPMNIVYQRDSTLRCAVESRAAQVLAQEQVTGIDSTLARWFANKTDPKYRQPIAQIRQWLTELDPLGYGITYRLFSQSDNAFVGRLGELRMPVLYLTGEDDPNSTPAMSMQMAQETPNGQAQVVPDEAHMMSYISPEKINPIIQAFIG